MKTIVVNSGHVLPVLCPVDTAVRRPSFLGGNVQYILPYVELKDFALEVQCLPNVLQVLRLTYFVESIVQSDTERSYLWYAYAIATNVVTSFSKHRPYVFASYPADLDLKKTTLDECKYLVTCLSPETLSKVNALLFSSKDPDPGLVIAELNYAKLLLGLALTGQHLELQVSGVL